MKKIIFLFLLFACAEEQVAPKVPTVTYTSIEGRWKFSTVDISGEFEIVDYDGVLTVDNGPGNVFSINGKSYAITTKRAVEGKLPGKLTIFLLGDKGSINLREIDVNKDYTEMTVDHYNYVVNEIPTIFYKELIITR